LKNSQKIFKLVIWQLLLKRIQPEHTIKNESTLTFLFNKLMERCDVDRGLFMFNDGSARIDISGHVYRGMINLIK